MGDHDPLCPVEEYGVPYLCLCELLIRAYTDERERMGDMLRTYEQEVRERIAQAIEEAIPPGDGPWAHSVYREAARIARDEGRE